MYSSATNVGGFTMSEKRIVLLDFVIFFHELVIISFHDGKENRNVTTTNFLCAAP